MINERHANKFCRDDYRKIENYDKAISDTTKTWHLHHRDEIRVLPSGMIVYRSANELKENGRYFNCPANELIFLTQSEHQRLHMKGKTISAEHRQKLIDSCKGKPRSAEVRQRIAATVKANWERRKAKKDANS